MAPEIQQIVDSHLARQAANRERRMAEDEQFTKVCSLLRATIIVGSRQPVDVDVLMIVRSSWSRRSRAWPSC